jgi:hypothetical protein
VEIDGRELRIQAFGGEFVEEPGHYAPRLGERLSCPVLALHKGSGPEFGYALARRDVPVRIDAQSAEVAGRSIRRRARRVGPLAGGEVG